LAEVTPKSLPKEFRGRVRGDELVGNGQDCEQDRVNEPRRLKVTPEQSGSLSLAYRLFLAVIFDSSQEKITPLGFIRWKRTYLFSTFLADLLRHLILGSEILKNGLSDCPVLPVPLKFPAME
jgi:hypothetical protein